MTRRPDGDEPEPVGGGAAERRRQMMEERFGKDAVSEPEQEGRENEEDEETAADAGAEEDVTDQ